MWGTPLGAAAASGDGSRARMEKFLSENSSEYNGQRCHSNREQTDFTSEDEDDDKPGRFLYPVLDLHKSGQTSQDDNSKLWSAPSNRITPPLAHSHASVGGGGGGVLGGGLVSPLGFPDRGRHHHMELLQQHHDRSMAERDGAGGVHNMRIDSLPPVAPSMQNGGGRTSPHIMIPPGPFVHPSVMSPSYVGAGGPVRQLQQDSLLRRGGGGGGEMSASTDVGGMDVFQRHSSSSGGGGGEVTDRGIGVGDIYMRRGEAGGVDHGAADVYGGLRAADTTDAFLHRSDMLERDLNAYLRRNDISESEVDAFLRRNDISECYIATALSQLARSIPGFR